MRRDRLERLADLLESDPATWPRDDQQPDRPVGFNLNFFFSRSRSCGTAACAAGLAALHPAFRAEGFDLDRIGCPRLRLPGEFCPRLRLPGEKEPLYGWAATGRFFGLDYEPGSRFGSTAIDRLFDPDCYPPEEQTDPKAVARRIRRALAGDPLDDWDSWKRPAAGGRGVPA